MLTAINHLLETMWPRYHVYPNVANLHREKTRQGASDVTARRFGQVEAYSIVREILAEASKGIPPKAGLWREFSGFGRFRFAMLGFQYWLQKVLRLFVLDLQEGLGFIVPDDHSYKPGHGISGLEFDYG